MKSTFYIFALSLAFIFSINGTAHAQNKISLSMPVDCIPGESCFVQKYVDMDPSPKAQDFKCGTLSDDTHQGTDIRVPSYREMEAGVDVLATADGKVVDVRNGMPDVSSKLLPKDAIKKRGYGNRVAIKHAGNYMTIYAHLKRGSLKVKVGDMVKQGQTLGQVGLSGWTEYPHLHFELRHGRKIIDPYTGMGQNAGCEQFQNSYWNDDTKALLEYTPTFAISAGFSSVTLNRAAAEYQLYEDLISAKTKTFLFNVYMAGAQLGDQFSIRILSPDGKTAIFNGSDTFTKGSVVRQLAGGKNNRTKALPKGIYTGEFILTRNGVEHLSIRKKVKVY